jgi:hypothetical protein
MPALLESQIISEQQTRQDSETSGANTELPLTNIERHLMSGKK